MLQGAEETLDYNWKRSSNSKVQILLQFCKMRKQANCSWTKRLNHFNLNCSFAEGMLKEKQNEVLMNCEACRTSDTMSTGENWNLVAEIDFWSGSDRRFLIFDHCQGGDGGGEADETKLSQLWRDSTYRSSCCLCCLNIPRQNDQL